MHTLRASLGLAAAILSLPVALRPAGAQPLFTNHLLAKAPIDECYCGFGDPENITRFETGFAAALTANQDCSGVRGGLGDDTGNDLPSDRRSQCIPKANGTYVWGTAVSGEASERTVWWGTNANGACWANQAQLLPLEVPSNFGTPRRELQSRGFPTIVCEGADSAFPLDPAIPEQFGDFRPPEIWYLRLGADPPATAGQPVRVDVASACSAAAGDLLARTVGVRSAGATPQHVILAGPDISGGAINLFLFRNRDAQCLAYRQFTQYNDVRKWITLEGNQLYAAVGDTGGRGSVLRWRPSVTNPLFFEVVGDLGAAGANITSHQGRLYVATWPNVSALDLPAGDLGSLGAEDLANLATNLVLDVGIGAIYRGPLVPSTGLDGTHLGQWDRIWSIQAYEPNPLGARTIGMGDLASNGDELCWGTMQVPNSTGIAHLFLFEPDLLDCASAPDFECIPGTPKYDPVKEARFAEILRNNERPTSIFCASGLELGETGEGETGGGTLPIGGGLLDETGGLAGFGSGETASALSNLAATLFAAFLSSPGLADLVSDVVDLLLDPASLPYGTPIGPELCQQVGSFVTCSLRATPAIRLLYGEAELPTYVPSVAGGSSDVTGWQTLPNLMLQQPLFGAAGFGAQLGVGANPYAWTAVNCFGEREILFGTLDFSPAPDGTQSGADLWLLPDGTRGGPALPLDLRGVGNNLNGGVRTAVCLDGDKLLLGFTNSNNLARSAPPPDGIGTGGWELRLLKQGPPLPPDEFDPVVCGSGCASGETTGTSTGQAGTEIAADDATVPETEIPEITEPETAGWETTEPETAETVASAPEIGGDSGGSGSTGGESVATASAELVGDVNGDGVVGASDFLLLARSFATLAAGNPADLNRDGGVGAPDFLLLARNFGRRATVEAERVGVASETSLPNGEETLAGGETAAPEPAGETGTSAPEASRDSDGSTSSGCGLLGCLLETILLDDSAAEESGGSDGTTSECGFFGFGCLGT